MNKMQMSLKFDEKESVPEKNYAKKNVWDKRNPVEQNSYFWNKEIVISGKFKELKNKPVVVELFCGCGGTSLGFEMAGYQVAIGSDIHAPSIETFRLNHLNSATILGDVNHVKADNIKEILNGTDIDVMIAGVPCQGFSLNNRKRHLNDKRNYLYFEFARLIKELKPKCVVLENVSGMKSSGNFISDIERDLGEAGNMVVKSKLLYAPDYGVPQKRNRMVFVGIRDKIFDFKDIIKTHGPEVNIEYNTIKDAIGDLPSLGIKEAKFNYKSKPISDYQKLMRKNSPKKLSNHNSPNHPKETIERIKNTKPGDPMYSNFKQRIRLSWDILSPTQVCGGIRPQFQFSHPQDPRGLTIRERCRIQSFPDNFHVSGGTVQGRVQTGNAVPPLLAKAIALAIKKYI